MAQLYSAILPRTQDLLKSLRAQAVPRPDSQAAPAANEIELNQFSLQVRPRVFRKSWDLRRKTHLIFADGRSQFIDPHPVQFLVRNRRNPRNRGYLRNRGDSWQNRARKCGRVYHNLHSRAHSAKCA